MQSILQCAERRDLPLLLRGQTQTRRFHGPLRPRTSHQCRLRPRGVLLRFHGPKAVVGAYRELCARAVRSLELTSDGTTPCAVRPNTNSEFSKKRLTRLWVSFTSGGLNPNHPNKCKNNLPLSRLSLFRASWSVSFFARSHV